VRDRISLNNTPRFIYGNADEGGFFRPLHDADEIRRLSESIGSLKAVERMGLIDHQWALVRAGQSNIGSMLDLASGFAHEADADVLATLRKPLSFIAGSLIPEAAPACSAPMQAWLIDHFEPPFVQLGWKPAVQEPSEIRLRRAALLGIVGSVAASPSILEISAQHCDRYLANRRSIDPNLADAIVSLGARVGDAALHRSFVEAATTSASAQEKRRFLLALGDFREAKLINKTLTFALTDAVATQDVAFLLMRLFANPAARERTWAFTMRRWGRIQKRVPPHLCSYLIEMTPVLRTNQYKREVAKFFRENPVPTGERALRQALERFDWYRGFRGQAAKDLTKWLKI
jgi:aminopeptidase N